ncbi:MAG: hypothetical protein DHS80DRAFT_22232 [Piptocephalis tieghemiana]|nr:MAG: hypothetical protein DHS80DRAFT_22232 [Piptocephalis tieghemiana]
MGRLLSLGITMVLLMSSSSLFPRVQAFSTQKMLCLVNIERAKYHLPYLGLSDALTRAAYEHCEDQKARNSMDHADSRGRSLGTRYHDAGYTNWKDVGENVSEGQRSEEECMVAWMKSPQHRDNILSSQYTHFGAFVAYRGSKPFYTQSFAGDGAQHSFGSGCSDDMTSSGSGSESEGTLSSVPYVGSGWESEDSLDSGSEDDLSLGGLTHTRVLRWPGADRRYAKPVARPSNVPAGAYMTTQTTSNGHGGTRTYYHWSWSSRAAPAA